MTAVRSTGLSQFGPDVQNAFQTLRTNIQFAGIDREIKTIAVTSALPSEGKSTVAVLLAMAMAESGKRTLLMDCDCRRPMLGNRLGLRPPSTWLDIIARDVSAESAIIQAPQPNLFFLDTEAQVPHAVELMGSNRFARLIAELRQGFDTVIFDTPPLGSFIEGAVLAAHMDGTVLIIGADQVNVQKAEEVIAQLKKANAFILGAVLNGAKVNRKSDYYYYYYNRSDGRRKRRR